MTDDQRSFEAIERAAALVPLLAERLERHGLGEIEVRQGDFRLRTAGRAQAGAAQPAAELPASAVDPVVAEQPGSHATGNGAQASRTGRAEVRSPAVGFFLYADGLGPGLEVSDGDSVGHVEMLGVRHEVRAPETGVVRHLVAESGEAVEYGQVLVEVDPEPVGERDR